MFYNNPNVLGKNYGAYNALVNYNSSFSVYKIATIMDNPSLQYNIRKFVLENSIGGFDRKKFYVREQADGSFKTE